MSRPTGPARKFRGLAVAAAALVSALAASCRSADVAEYSLATPEKALDSFQRALEAGDYEHEYLSLSSELKRELDLSYNTYTLGRGSFLRQHRDEVRLFRRSEIARVTYSADRRTARVELSAGESLGEIVLVNEPHYEWVVDDGSGRGAEDGGRLEEDVPAYVHVADGRLVVDVPLAGPPPEGGEIAEVRVSRAWKFKELLGIREFRFDEAASRAEREGASGTADP